MEKQDNTLSLASDLRIQKLIEEADIELNKIQPEIDYLENCLTKLNELKLKKNKLLSLKASLKVVLNQVNITSKGITNLDLNIRNIAEQVVTSIKYLPNETQYGITSQHKLFVPDLALDQVLNFLRPNKNLNFEIFKAVVHNGGHASTEEIKNYLVTNKICQPKTGKFFDDVELKDISSRANYLVRKKLLISSRPGLFTCALGFTDNEIT